MSLKEFNKRFGEPLRISSEQKKFVVRVNDIIWDDVKEDLGGDYESFLQYLLFSLGESYKDFVAHFGREAPLVYITKNDFLRTLKVLTVMLNYGKCSKNFIDEMENAVIMLMRESPINLGIEFSGKQFYPTGEKLLDKELIDFAMESLKPFPEQNKILQDALKHYVSKDLRNTIQDCYVLFEGLVRNLLKNDRTLDSSKADLLRCLKLSGDWGKMLSAFIDYMHDHRHASGEIPLPKETEACLYQTCLFVRLIVKDLPADQK